MKHLINLLPETRSSGSHGNQNYPKVKRGQQCTNLIVYENFMNFPEKMQPPSRPSMRGPLA